MVNIKLSIVVPCYNEEKNIPLILKKINEVTIDRSDIEVILVNNGSTDNSKNIMEQLAHLPKNIAIGVLSVVVAI